MYAVLALPPPGHEVHMQAEFPHVVRGAPFVFCKGVNISLSQVLRRLFKTTFSDEQETGSDTRSTTHRGRRGISPPYQVLL